MIVANGSKYTDISFIVNPIATYGVGGWCPDTTMLGGSEEMVVETAKRLAKNYKVTVYHNGKHGIFDDVFYKDHSEFKNGDITINLNYPEFPSGGIYWTTLDKNPNLSQFDVVCAISQYAKDHTGIIHDNIYIVPPGYDPNKIKVGRKISKQCFYGSSPDRGLDKLLEVWPSVIKAHPDATLILTYGANVPPQQGIINLGLVDEITMNEIYATSEIWAYPCSGVELYCMTGVKAQVAGCYPVIIPYMALAETVKFGHISNQEGYCEALIDALGQYEKVIPNLDFPTWDDVVNKLEKIFDTVYNGNI